MARYHYPYVEDYIEIIAGYMDIAGKNPNNLFTLGQSPINLARYDTRIVPSLAEQAMAGQGYTDRQAELAIKLIIKYERQLSRLGLDISPVQHNPAFRNPIRVLDRSKRVWIQDQRIYIKFPYNVALIDLIRDQSHKSQGHMSWDVVNKIWTADLTEYNVNWVYAMAQAHGFVIDPNLEQVMQQITEVEKQGHVIQLTYDQSALTITNAAESLTAHVQEHLGGFGEHNLIPLIDHAPVLGYTVESVIEQSVIAAYGTRFYSLCMNRHLKCDADISLDLINSIVEYAMATQRFPIFVYEPDLSYRILKSLSDRYHDLVVSLDDIKGSDPAIDIQNKIVYTSKIPRSFLVTRIPLLITTSGMMFGGERQIWLQDAEKVVYFSTEVYNKHKEKGSAICKLY